jgi:alpha-glucosidase
MPYYYSLAYAAWRRGDPVFPSVDYWFPEATETRELGHEKMIGSELLSAGVATFDAEEVDVYLPAGDWYVFRTGAVIHSAGETFTFPVHEEGRFQLPLLARDGAVVPVEGGVLTVFGTAENVFEWYDDDGSSTGYRTGDFDLIRVLVNGDRVLIQRGAGFGIAPKTLRWVRPDFTPVASVTINGMDVPFTQTDGALSIALPAFSDRVVVEVR